MQQEQYLKEQNEEFENEKQILNEKIKNAEKDCETTEIEITKLNEQNSQLENTLNEIMKELKKETDKKDTKKTKDKPKQYINNKK